jgi:hypothetical protein
MIDCPFFDAAVIRTNAQLELPVISNESSLF